MKKWYVLRDLSRRNSRVMGHELLRQAGLEVYTPMMQMMVGCRPRRERRDVPVIQDLLFVHEDKSVLDGYVEMYPKVQYRYVRGRSVDDPLTVSDADMDRFIAAATGTDSPRFYMPGELTPAMYGRQVRIVGGPFDGYEGRLLSVRGLRSRRLIVEIPNLIAVSVEVRPEYVQMV